VLRAEIRACRVLDRNELTRPLAELVRHDTMFKQRLKLLDILIVFRFGREREIEGLRQKPLAPDDKLARQGTLALAPSQPIDRAAAHLDDSISARRRFFRLPERGDSRPLSRNHSRLLALPFDVHALSDLQVGSDRLGDHHQHAARQTHHDLLAGLLGFVLVLRVVAQ
jgi:hypothetical protein